MIKYLQLIVVVFIVCGCSKSENQNVILILVDDLGYRDVGYNSEMYQTPYINELASKSLIFNEAYSSASNGLSSRASLFTGFYPPRHGVYTTGSSARGYKPAQALIPVKNKSKLSYKFNTISRIAKSAGYKTALIGKWGLNKEPLNCGFDTNIAGSLLNSPYSYFSPYNLDNIINGPMGENLTERLTNETMKFIESYKNSSFFVTLSYYDIHTPLQSSPLNIQSIKKYNPLIENAVYAAMIENLDKNIGRLTSFLKEERLLDNTVIIFTSDNGAVAGFSDQNPYRAGKGSYYDGGIRVPLFIYKNGVTNGERTNHIVTGVDILPTIAELMGVTTVNADGVSLVPLMYDQKTDYSKRAVYWHFPIYLEAFNPQEDDARDPLFRTRPGSAVRFQDWKLHEYFEDDAIELYNLKTDPGERINLVEQYPEKAKELYFMLDEWRKTTKAPLPLKRENMKILSNN